MPPSGSIDSKLTGHWRCETSIYDAMMRSTYVSITDYYFNADGTFSCEDKYPNQYKFEGKYSAADGKVYFTEIKKSTHLIGGGWSDYTAMDNVLMEYKFGSDSEGEYLLILPLGRSGGNYFEAPSADSGFDFRKQ